MDECVLTSSKSLFWEFDAGFQELAVLEVLGRVSSVNACPSKIMHSSVYLPGGRFLARLPVTMTRYNKPESARGTRTIASIVLMLILEKKPLGVNDPPGTSSRCSIATILYPSIATPEVLSTKRTECGEAGAGQIQACMSL